MSLRLSSLDYLGLVASRLRRDAVQSKLKLETIDTIISSVKVSRSKSVEGVKNKNKEGHRCYEFTIPLEYTHTFIPSQASLNISSSCSTVSDPVLDWDCIRIQMGQWIRILIGNPDPDRPNLSSRKGKSQEISCL